MSAATIFENDTTDFESIFGSSTGEAPASHQATPVGIRPNEAPDDPYRIAVAIRDRYMMGEDRTLAHYRGEFHTWTGTHWRRAPEFKDKELIEATKREVDRLNVEAIASFMERGTLAAMSAKGGRHGKAPVAPKITKGLVASVAMNLGALTSIDRDEAAPFWIERMGDDPDPFDLIPTTNGIVNVDGEEPVLMAHTPRLFATGTTPFAFDPEAPVPRLWEKFTRDLWPGDEESIGSLHEQLGDMIRPDPKHHAIFLWIGAPRSGRSTLREVASAMIGPQNVASTSAAALGSPFGLEPLLGRSVAFLGDARMGDSGDSAILTDRLLRMSGNDPLEVNRKGRPILDQVRLGTRLVVITNEMPNIRDASGAIVKRYVILETPRTIPAEDRDADLAEKLKAELPGIFNLALQGRARLKDRGRFLQPEACKHLLEDAQDIASPVGLFVKECLERRAEASITALALFKRWQAWATEHGYPPGNSGAFGKNFRAAECGIKSSRPRVDGKQCLTYHGIGDPREMF